MWDFKAINDIKHSLGKTVYYSEGRRELADLARIYTKCAGFDTSSMHGEGSCEFTGWG